MEFPTLVLIDDEPDDLVLFERLLKRFCAKNRIVSFESASHAFPFLEREAAAAGSLGISAVIFTDLNMPLLGGIEVIRWVRSHPQLSRVRTVVVTGAADPARKQQALAEGADSVLPKFPDAETLLRIASV